MAATTVQTTIARPRARKAATEQPIARARRRRLTRAGLYGIGAALPDRVVTNHDLVEQLDTDDAWIVRRTGIRERRWLPEGAPLAPLAADACAAALEDAGIDPADVDHIIVSTITPDRVTPGLGPEVAGIIGADHASALDLNAACAGFLYGLDHAAALVESGRARIVVVCGAEALSRITDQDDRSTAVLFGDGAGAAVVCAGDGLEIGIGTFDLGLDATKADLLYAERDEQRLRMEGREVYRHAVRRMVEATSIALARAGLTVADIDLFVAHQANVRILHAAADELGVPRELVAVNVDVTANTSSASIPLALARAEREGRLRPGATVAMAAFGAGFVWGAGIVGWKESVYPCA